jgi:malate dehydrogenase (oxaloacetate-decarboxylating)(NADP+)
LVIYRIHWLRFQRDGLQSNILETETQTAARVAKLVFDSGLARVDRPADMVSFIRTQVYKPECGLETKAAAGMA